MKLELGKKYVNRMGEVVGPMEATKWDHPFAGSHQFQCGHRTFKENGAYSLSGPSYSLDLIAEYNPSRFVVGVEYKDVSGLEWICISVNDDGAHLAMKSHPNNAAYFWNADGTSKSLGKTYNIKFPPVIEWKTFTSYDESTLRVPFVDGVPDYSRTEERW